MDRYDSHAWLITQMLDRSSNIYYYFHKCKICGLQVKFSHSDMNSRYYLNSMTSNSCDEFLVKRTLAE